MVEYVSLVFVLNHHFYANMLASYFMKKCGPLVCIYVTRSNDPHFSILFITAAAIKIRNTQRTKLSHEKFAKRKHTKAIEKKKKLLLLEHAQEACHKKVI